MSNIAEKNTIEKIYQSSLKFLVPLSLNETFETVIREAITLVNGSEGIILLEKKGGFNKVYTSSNIVTNSKIRPRGYTYKAFKYKKAFVMDYKTLKKAHPELAKVGVKSVIFIPLLYKDEAIGVLIIRSDKENNFSSLNLGVLKLFGSFASVAIRKSQLYSEAREALEVRDLFISMASHELKTPITTISGYTDLIKNKLDKGSKINPRWITSMHRENKRLTYLINELLEINQIRQGKLSFNFKECNILQTTKTAISNFSVQYPDRKILFTNNLSNGLGKIIADPDKILQALENVFVNAAKFSDQKTSIEVSISKQGKFLQIIVKDAGIGIKKESLHKIFEKYYKANPNKKEGMGLGLYLVKEVVKNHKGVVKVRSKKNNGTIVTLLLPIINYES